MGWPSSNAGDEIANAPAFEVVVVMAVSSGRVACGDHTPGRALLRDLTPRRQHGDPPRVTSYDRIDWHLDGAIDAGQPEEHAFTHIGLYLAWLIRHDLHDPQVFPEEHVKAVKAGDMSGSDLRDDIDGKLFGGVMNRDGRAFSDARYEIYLDEYAYLFHEVPEYGVDDGPEAYDKVERLLDRMYAMWVDGGRQAPPPRRDATPIDGDFAPTSSTVMIPPGFGQEQIDELLAHLPGDVQVLTSDAIHPRSHVAPELESLIPADLTSPTMETESVRAKTWGSSLLTRALRRLRISPKDAVVVHAIGGDGEGTMTATIYSVPGIDAERLTTEFRFVIFHIPGSTWEPRTIGGREVQWASSEEFTVVFWARDGMVIHATGQPEVLVPAITRLP